MYCAPVNQTNFSFTINFDNFSNLFKSCFYYFCYYNFQIGGLGMVHVIKILAMTEILLCK